MTGFIYHITSLAAWNTGQKEGEYRADSLEREGFIHCSKADQILRVANNYYGEQHGLVILIINPSELKNEVRWEVGTDKADELFPHIYGVLNPKAVIRVIDFEPEPDGKFTLPTGLA